MDRFPREPRDDEEREACGSPYCDAPSPDDTDVKCSLPRGHGGDHIAIGISDEGDDEVLARWPQTPDHSGDAAEMVEPVEVRAGAIVRTSTGVFVSEPCPFDGGKGEVTRSHVEGDPTEQTSYTVQCVSCAAVGPWHGTEEGARDGWAKRAGTAGTLRGVVGHRFSDGTMIVFIEGTCTVGREGTRSLYVRADELRAEVGQRVKLRIEVDNG